MLGVTISGNSFACASSLYHGWPLGVLFTALWRTHVKTNLAYPRLLARSILTKKIVSRISSWWLMPDCVNFPTSEAWSGFQGRSSPKIKQWTVIHTGKSKEADRWT